jgi:hypothetical protein
MAKDKEGLENPPNWIKMEAAASSVSRITVTNSVVLSRMVRIKLARELGIRDVVRNEETSDQVVSDAPSLEKVTHKMTAKTA